MIFSITFITMNYIVYKTALYAIIIKCVLTKIPKNIGRVLLKFIKNQLIENRLRNLFQIPKIKLKVFETACNHENPKIFGLKISNIHQTKMRFSGVIYTPLEMLKQPRKQLN